MNPNKTGAGVQAQELKARITKKDARHIVAKYLLAYSTLFDRLDEDVYNGTMQGDLPDSIRHLAELDGTLMIFFPNEKEKELMQAESYKITRMLRKLTHTKLTR